MKKCGLILFTLLCLLLSSAALAEWDEEKIFEYRVLENGTAEIISCSKYSWDGPMEIPSQIGGYTVTSIGENAFKSKSRGGGYILPDTLVSIGKNAFSTTYDIQEFIIPDSVTYIGEGAFSQCSKLTRVVMPKGKVELGGNPFHQCRKLTDIVFSADHPSLSWKNGVLFNENKYLVYYPETLEDKEYTVPDGTEAILSYAFHNLWDLKKITLPSSITSIDDYGLMKIFYLEEINLPAGLKNLGSYAFQNCEALKTIYLPAALQKIGKNPFQGCKALQSVTLDPQNPHFIVENYALIGAASRILYMLLPGAPADYQVPIHALFMADSALAGQKLQSLIFHPGFVSIGDSALEGSSVVHVTLPEALTSIGSRAFAQCASLQEIEIPRHVRVIGDEAFSDCKALRKATIHSGAIGKKAFNHCTALQELNLLDGVTDLGYYAFFGCAALPKVSIPGTVTHVGSNIFPNCSSLAEVIFQEGVESLGSYNFTSGFNIRISLPASLQKIENGALNDDYNHIAWVAKGSPAEEYAKYWDIIYAYHGEELSFPEEPGAFHTVEEVRNFLQEKAANMETEFTFYCSGDLLKLILSDIQCEGLVIPGFSLIQSLLNDVNIQKHSLTYYTVLGKVEVKCLYWQGWRLATLYQQGKTASLTEQEQKVLNLALEIVNDVKAQTNDPWQIEKLLNDAICKRIQYPSFYSDFSFGSNDLKPPKEEESVLTLFEKGIADCEGYSDTFFLLGSLAGLDVRYMLGTLKQVGHAWNIVFLDGEWHFLDVTNNDYNSNSYNAPPITNHYYYFNMGQAEAQKMFAWEDRYCDEAIASKTRDHLYYYTSHGNQIYTDLNSLSSYIASCRKAGDQEIAAMVDGAIAIEEIKAMLQKDFGGKGIKSYSWVQLGDHLLIIPIFSN